MPRRPGRVIPGIRPRSDHACRTSGTWRPAAPSTASGTCCSSRTRASPPLHHSAPSPGTPTNAPIPTKPLPSSHRRPQGRRRDCGHARTPHPRAPAAGTVSGPSARPRSSPSPMPRRATRPPRSWPPSSTRSTTRAAGSATTPSSRALNAAPGRWTAVSPPLPRARSTSGSPRRATTDGLVDPTLGRALRVLGYDRDFAQRRRRRRAVRGCASNGPRAGARSTSTTPGRRRPARPRRRARPRRDRQGVRRRSRRAAHRRRRPARASSSTSAATARSPARHPQAAGPSGSPTVTTRRPDAPGATVALSAGGLATSGTTARHWTRGGRRAPPRRRSEHRLARRGGVAHRDRRPRRPASTPTSSTTAAIVLGARRPAGSRPGASRPGSWLGRRGRAARRLAGRGARRRPVLRRHLEGPVPIGHAPTQIAVSPDIGRRAADHLTVATDTTRALSVPGSRPIRVGAWARRRARGRRRLGRTGQLRQRRARRAEGVDDRRPAGSQAGDTVTLVIGAGRVDGRGAGPGARRLRARSCASRGGSRRKGSSGGGPCGSRSPRPSRSPTPRPARTRPRLCEAELTDMSASGCALRSATELPVGHSGRGRAAHRRDRPDPHRQDRPGLAGRRGPERARRDPVRRGRAEHDEPHQPLPRRAAPGDLEPPDQLRPRPSTPESEPPRRTVGRVRGGLNSAPRAPIEDA